MNLAPIHQLQIITRYWRGDLDGVEKHFAAWLAFFSDSRFAQSPPLTLNNAVNALAFASYNAWALGLIDVARQRESQMIAVANRGSVFEIANSGYLTLAIYLGQYERAEALATRTIQLAEKHHFPNPVVRSQTVLGLARAHLGHASEGVALIRRGIAGLREIGTRMGITQTMARLAEAQGLAGNISEALESVEIGLQALPDEVVFRPEMLRLRGELRLRQGDAELAEADFREAIALAQKMSAKSWELRATMSLARLLRDTGRRDEARAMLAQIYGWFTEGFDTADLKDAKTLLDELGV